MPPFTVSTVLQVVMALTLLNVWLLRAKSSTMYRGGEADSLREEFRAYGLPDWAFYAIGALKITSAILLLVGLWWPPAVQPAAGTLVLLMLGAVAMHIKVKDPLVRALPAATLLAMSAVLVA